MQRRTILKLGTGAAVSGVLTACGGSADPAPQQPPPMQAPQLKVVAGWTNMSLEAVRTVKPGPPMAARSFALLHTSMYNAWAAYDAVARATPHVPALRRPVAERTAANKAMAMSYAAHAMLADQFPSQKAAFDAYLESLGYEPGVRSADVATPAGLAAVLTAALIEYCHADGANQLGNLTPGGTPYADYTGYTPQNAPLAIDLPTARSAIAAPGNWVPLTYADGMGVVRTPPYLAAGWDRVKPFALASASEHRPGPPVAFGTHEFKAQVHHMVELTAALTEHQKVSAEYWADGPSSELPPGHWLLFALYVSERDEHTDDEDVKMLFALSNALSDAAIAAWDAKRAYDSARPISAVRYVMNERTIMGYGPQGPAGGLRPIQGAAWVPYQPLSFPTPPFPEHVSGHSTFSAAGAEVLKRFTGSDAFGASFTRRARTMQIEPGMPTSDITLGWASFSDAAQEAGISRIYGGIHFPKGNVDGLELGRKVGAQAFEKARGLWHGAG